MAGTAGAQTQIKGAASGLTGSFLTIDFDSLAVPTSTLLTNQLSAQGLNFIDTFFSNTPHFGGSVFGTAAIYNFNLYPPSLRSSMSIHFLQRTNAVAFNIASLQGDVVFETFLNGQLVSTFTEEVDQTSEASKLFWGFEGFEFDMLRITSKAPQGVALGIDNLQLPRLEADDPETSVVPEPATAILVVTGLAAMACAKRKRRRC